MLKKLNLVLRSPASQSISKSLIASVLLAWLGDNWLITVVFVGLSAYFYFRPVFNSSYFFYSFLVLLAVFLTFIDYWSVYWAVAVFGIMFFLLLGVKNLIFINRSLFYNFLNNFLLLAVFFLFFLSDQSQFFLIKYLAVFLAVFFLWREFLFFSVRSVNDNLGNWQSKINLLAMVFSFLVFQVFWATALLPIGFLNAGAFMLLTVLVMKDLLINHLSGVLGQQEIMKNATIFIVFSVIIFAASIWTP